MNRLDINTPRGRQAARDQARALEIVSAYSGLEFAATDDTERAVVDAVAIRKSRIAAVVEVKSRDMTTEKLSRAYNARWLVTLDKIKSAAAIAGALRVPLIGLLYLVPEDLVFSVALADKNGQLICDYVSQKTTTQATCNGGLAFRENAFINMSKAKQYQGRCMGAQVAPALARF